MMEHTILIAVLVAMGLVIIYPVILLSRIPEQCDVTYSIRDEISEINDTLDSILNLVKQLLERLAAAEVTG